MKKHIRFLLILLVFTLCGHAYGAYKNYTHTFAEGDMKVGNVEWNNNNPKRPLLWTFIPEEAAEQGTVIPYNFSDGLRIGTSTRPFKGMHLKTSGIPGVIKSVKITATSSATGSSNVSVALSIDGNQVGDAQPLSNDMSKKVTFKADASGEICLTFTPKGKQSPSFTLKEISIQYDPPTVAVTIGATGYATLYYGTQSLEVPNGLTASTYTVSGGKMIESKVYAENDVIPAGTGVVLHGNPGTYELTESFATGDTAPANMLKGSDVDATINSDGGRCYMLSLNAQHDPNSVGFYYGAENGGVFVTKAHHAYLSVPRSTAAKSCYPLGREVTGIDAIQNDKCSPTTIYTLQGIRVDGKNLPHGIYVVNGKKVAL